MRSTSPRFYVTTEGCMMNPCPLWTLTSSAMLSMTSACWSVRFVVALSVRQRLPGASGLVVPVPPRLFGHPLSQQKGRRAQAGVPLR